MVAALEICKKFFLLIYIIIFSLLTSQRKFFLEKISPLKKAIRKALISLILLEAHYPRMAFIPFTLREKFWSLRSKSLKNLQKIFAFSCPKSWAKIWQKSFQIDLRQSLRSWGRHRCAQNLQKKLVPRFRRRGHIPWERMRCRKCLGRESPQKPGADP